MKILLVEDGQEKRQAIASVVAQCGLSCDLITAVDVVDAKRTLSAQRFDLLLLDIKLPVRASGPPEVDGGLEILRWLRARGRPFRPPYIVGVTSVEEALSRAEREFDNLIWSVVGVNLAASEWREALRKTLIDISDQLRPPYRGDGVSFRSDILVVTALNDPELTEILAIGGFEPLKVDGDASHYYKARLTRGRRFADVVAVAASDKGLVGAAVATVKGITAFWPRFVYMPGIAAGVPGKTNIGDVVFADLTWDYGSGKAREEAFSPAPYQRRLDESLSAAAKTFDDAQAVLYGVWSRWPGPKPPGPPCTRVGVMASGAAVLQSSSEMERVARQHKDLLAVEMEAFAVMFACEASPSPRPRGIVAKAICDCGDRTKTDDYQQFAARCSAAVFEEFALRVLAQEPRDYSSAKDPLRG